MKKTIKTIMMALAMISATTLTAFADTANETSLSSTKALVAGILIAVASAVGAISMAIAVSKSAESTARQPEAAGELRTSMMMGLVFIETAIIYALIIAILIIFVL